MVSIYCDAMNLDKKDKRNIMLLAMDIERETRQECVSKAYALANELANSK